MVSIQSGAGEVVKPLLNLLLWERLMMNMIDEALKVLFYIIL